MRQWRWAVLVLVPVMLAVGGGNRDVNGDGRVDLSDVRALARMAAGLDPAQTRFDQDGDGRITLKDVDILAGEVDLSSEPTPTPPAAARPTAPALRPSPEPGAVHYLVVEQAEDSRVVVAVGANGVKPGDRVLGVFDSLNDAIAARDRLASNSPLPEPESFASRPPEPTPVPPEPVVPAAPSVPELVGIAELIPLSPGRALAVSPQWREAWLVAEAGGRGGDVSLHRVSVGGIRDLDGPMTPPCPYFDPGGRGGSLFAFLPARGDARIIKDLRPGGDPRAVRVTMVPTLQGRSGGVLVLPRRGKNGETTGVYLYHWPSGTALFADGLASGARRLQSTRLAGFPVTSSEPLVFAASGRAGATRSFTVVDPTSGGVWCVLDVRSHPKRPRSVSTGASLAPLRPQDTAGRLALTGAPLMASAGVSSDVLLAEGHDGRLAMLEHHDDPSRIRLQVLDFSVDDLLPTSGSARRLLAAPLGRPGSVLLLDGVSGRMIVVAVQPGEGATIRAAEVRH